MSLDNRAKGDLSIDGVKFATLWLVVLGHVLLFYDPACPSLFNMVPVAVPGAGPMARATPFIAFICRSSLCWQAWSTGRERAALLSFGKKSSGSYYRVWQSSSVL